MLPDTIVCLKEVKLVKALGNTREPNNYFELPILPSLNLPFNLQLFLCWHIQRQNWVGCNSRVSGWVGLKSFAKTFEGCSNMAARLKNSRQYALFVMTFEESSNMVIKESKIQVLVDAVHNCIRRKFEQQYFKCLKECSKNVRTSCSIILVEPSICNNVWRMF